MTREVADEIRAILHYEFKNAALLESAFTHSSFVNEHDADGNERIEFLGDCVLNFLVGEKLYNQDPKAHEGALSSRRSAIVSRAPLARIVDKLGLMRFLRVGAGVDKSAFSDKARSDLFEAIVGAVYSDGGADACRAFLDDVFYPNVLPETDYKSALQVYATSRGLTALYETSESGNEFVSTVKVGDSEFTGRGATKHASQVDAARVALDGIRAKNGI